MIFGRFLFLSVLFRYVSACGTLSERENHDDERQEKMQKFSLSKQKKKQETNERTRSKNRNERTNEREDYFRQETKKEKSSKHAEK